MPYRPSLRRTANIWSRKLHRWGAIATLIPLLVVVGTGLLLQVRKQVAWVQPAEERGTGSVPMISFDEVLEAARSAPDARIQSWSDIDRLDIRPGKGLIKVRAKSDWEVQIDAGTGNVLSTKYRRSHIIEAIHEGAYFGEVVRFAVFVPAGVILLGLMITGAYLWVLPLVARRNGRRRRSARARAN